MAIRIGIDLGSSVLKLAALGGSDIVATAKQDNDPAASPEFQIATLLCSVALDVADVEGIVLTGVGARRVEGGTLYNRPVGFVEEFAATARGGLELSGRDRAVVASMGTGTAFLYAADGAVRHLGGSGVGGGTLMGMCRRLYGLQSFEDVVATAGRGDLNRVDTRIKDIASDAYMNLPPDLTSSNFGKSLAVATDADMVLGLVNMVLETAGVMAVLSCRATGAPCAVLTGSLLRLPQAEPTYATFTQNFGVEFILPPRAAFATAIGAALLYGGKGNSGLA
ncbi:MAG: hypothetical protein LUC93_18500 [Planctomycetaceae bacterium]|nr:hypothetical protein [Planctomycetaceae bacterium]